jgi:hypothetical protein
VSDAHTTRTVTHTLFHLSAREQESVILHLWKAGKAMRGDKQTETHTHKHTHTPTHLAGRSATYWAHLGGFHNLRGTVAQ